MEKLALTPNLAERAKQHRQTEHLKDEVHRALDLLTNLTRPNPPQKPLGELNPKAIKRCRGIFFFHTKKVGLALGLKWGAGVLLAHILDENGKESWSAPVLFKVYEVSLGLLAGVGHIQTMLILGSEKAVDQFRVGAKKGPVVLGQDLSLGKTLGFDVVEDANIFASRDIITHSLADGAIVDWSLIGGKISVDKDSNAAIYGKDVDLEKVLGAPSSTHSPPAALKPLYEALDGIATDAEGDMRRFNGFRKHWSPDMSELKAKDA